jgi:hypothetical protein
LAERQNSVNSDRCALQICAEAWHYQAVVLVFLLELTEVLDDRAGL